MKRKGKIALTVGVLFFYELVLFAVCYLQTPNVPTPTIPRGEYMQTVSNIDGITDANPRFIDLSFLGSHDSTSYDIKYSSRIEPNFNSKASQFLSEIARGFGVRYAVTQNVDIEAQLSFGTRLFDFRVSEVDGGLYCYHNFIAGEFSEYIIPILKFLDENPGEIVVLMFQNTCLLTLTDAEFYEYMFSISYNGKTLSDYIRHTSDQAIASLTYNQLTNSGAAAGAVIFVPPSDTLTEGYRQVYTNRQSYNFKWMNEGQPDRLLDMLDEYYENLSAYQRDYFGFISADNVLSLENARGLAYALKKGGILKMAQELNATLIDDERLSEWLEVSPNIWVNYVNSVEGDFNRRINALLRERNEGLCQSSLSED